MPSPTTAEQLTTGRPHLTLTLAYPDTRVFACLEGRILTDGDDTELEPGSADGYEAARPVWLLRDATCQADGQCECDELSLWEAIEIAPDGVAGQLVRTHMTALRRETAHLKLLALQVAGAPTPESDGAVPVCASCILDPREHLERLSRSVSALGWELSNYFSVEPHPVSIGQ